MQHRREGEERLEEREKEEGGEAGTGTMDLHGERDSGGPLPLTSRSAYGAGQRGDARPSASHSRAQEVAPERSCPAAVRATASTRSCLLPPSLFFLPCFSSLFSHTSLSSAAASRTLHGARCRLDLEEQVARRTITKTGCSTSGPPPRSRETWRFRLGACEQLWPLGTGWIDQQLE